MLTKKFLASAVATIAIAGSIGVAIAQTTTPPALGTGTTKSEVPGSRTTTESNSSTTTTGTDSATTGTDSSNSSRDSSLGTPNTGAGSTMSNEASPRGTLN